MPGTEMGSASGEQDLDNRKTRLHPAGVPPSKYNIFGGSIGGPIVKNKLFIFGDYQGTRSSQGANVLLSVPSTSVRQRAWAALLDAGDAAICRLTASSSSGTLMNPNRSKHSMNVPERVKFRTLQ